MNLPRLEDAPELLDEPAHDLDELRRSLAHVADVNRYLGGNRALRAQLRSLLPANGRATIVDVGTGDAAVPLHLLRRFPDRLARVHGVDVHAQTSRIAMRAARSAGADRLTVVRGSALALPYPERAFDIVLLTLVLHHFDGADQRTVLREAGRVARRAVVVGELERTRGALLGARLLAATVWRRNRLTRHDGPLSVRRAFTPGELAAAATEAGLKEPEVKRHPLFRLVLVARPGPA